MGPIPRSSRSLAPHMAQLAGAKANGALEAAVMVYALSLGLILPKS